MQHRICYGDKNRATAVAEQLAPQDQIRSTNLVGPSADNKAALTLLFGAKSIIVAAAGA
jgi:hypothetical protein